MKDKSNHSKKPIEELSKNHSFVDLLDSEAFIFFPQKSEWRKKIIKTLEVWVAKPESYELQQFYDEYKIPERTMWDWRQKYAEIEDAMNRTKQTLGCKRRIGALTKKLDKDMVLRDLHRYDVYDKTEHENNMYHKEMNKSDAQTSSTIVIQGGALPKPGVISQKDMERSHNEAL